MKRILLTAAALGAVAAFVSTDALALGLNPKAKGKKFQTDLVTAMACGPSASDPVDCDDSSQDPAQQNSPCSFLKGKIKVQVGKEPSVQIKGLDCGGNPLPSGVCVQVEGMSTIADEEIAKDGSSTPETCLFAGFIPVEGTSSYTNTAVGAVPCDAKGNCKGTIPNTAADPCPDVDKELETRRVLVFDGPENALVEIIPGVSLGSCDPNNQNQVFARPGSIVQTK